MSLLVVGSVAIDSIETPRGKAHEVIGGSATHFSYSASFFSPVQLVGVVGDDFPTDYLEILGERPICTEGLQQRDGETFRWHGRYEGAMHDAETLEVELNLFGDFDPVLPESYRDSKHVFLANGSPQVQAKVLGQLEAPEFVLLDTMNLWIQTARPELEQLLPQVDALIVNDGELRMLTDEHNLIRAARKALELGPRVVIVKKGEHGSMVLDDAGRIFLLPAYPTAEVVDPTGAGDSFAGGVLGFLSLVAGDRAPRFEELRWALCYGTVMASFNVEAFSLERMRQLEVAQLEERLEELLRLCHPSASSEAPPLSVIDAAFQPASGSLAQPLSTGS